jgi:hypothetical protein
MLKRILVSTLIATSAMAASPVEFVSSVFNKVIQQSFESQNLIDWKQGESNTYNLDMGFIKGSMVQTVREVGADGIWMDQNMDLGFAGKQTASQLIDPATGEIKKFIVNGKEEKIPEQGEQEIVEVSESKVTVPAGTFECIFAKIKDKKSGDISQAWINPEKISIGGMIKIIQPSQFGQITISLKSFVKK